MITSNSAGINASLSYQTIVWLPADLIDTIFIISNSPDIQNLDVIQ